MSRFKSFDTHFFRQKGVLNKRHKQYDHSSSNRNKSTLNITIKKKRKKKEEDNSTKHPWYLIVTEKEGSSQVSAL